MKLTLRSFLKDTLFMSAGMCVAYYLFNGGTINGHEIFTAVGTSTLCALTTRPLLLHFGRKSAGKLLKYIVIELPAGESIIFEAGANHFKGKEAVGGKLVLTNAKRLIFKSHKFNIQNHQEAFSIGDIITASESKVKSDKPNILTLKFNNESVEKFVVDNPSEWIGAIAQQMKPA